MMQVGEPIPPRFMDWWSDDSAMAQKWWRQAREAFDFVSGKQWDDQTVLALNAELRPTMTFNRISPVIDAVSGAQISNRTETTYYPREEGDAQASEILTGGAQWFQDESEGDEEDSAAFLDCAISGMGWTETRLDYEDDPEGAPVVERINPMEMVWDANARRRNLKDARRIWRVQSITLDAAREMFPGFTDAELDAGWATMSRSQDGTSGPVRDRSNGEPAQPSDEITIVQVQWFERSRVWAIADPFTGEEIEVEADEYEVLAKRFEKIGLPMVAAERTRKAAMSAFFGGVILDIGEAPCPDRFSWSCVTGKRDENQRVFYGLVRGMKDPQEWANKWLSQSLHIMNRLAKGGVMMEADAAEGGADEVRKTWASPDGVTVFNPGALSQGKVQAKPTQAIPPQLMQMTEFAISSIRDVSGVNLEMLGMREANQPGVLEYQRRQAGITSLQWLFDGFRRYQRNRGILTLYYLQNDLSDGRLIRITGKEGAQYVPLVTGVDARYDVVVDDAATAPNQKERVWQILSQLLPTVREMITPAVMIELLEYSPLPPSVVAKLREMANEPDEAGQQKAEMAVRAAAAEVAKVESEAMENQAGAMRDQAGAFRDQAHGQKLLMEAQAAQLSMANPSLYPNLNIAV